jgi:hypothetical protein
MAVVQNISLVQQIGGPVPSDWNNHMSGNKRRPIPNNSFFVSTKKGVL